MTPKQVIAHFHTQRAVAKALGIKQPSVAEWVANGYIPLTRQCQIELITGGELRASLGRRRVFLGRKLA